MGVWGVGPFDNDDAANMVAKLMNPIERVLKLRSAPWDRTQGEVMETFKIGDFVRLKSGGPRMTAVSDVWQVTAPTSTRMGVGPISTISMITCQWFHGQNDGGVHAGDFRPETLVRAESPEEYEAQLKRLSVLR